MKKTMTILLTIYLTLTTIASVWFGVHYFLPPKTEDTKLTKSEAYSLVNTVCYDMNYINAEDYRNSTRASSQISANAELSYYGDNVDWSEFSISSLNFQQYILFARQLLSSANNYEEGESYKSSVTFFPETSNEFTIVYYVNYEITENGLILHGAEFSSSMYNDIWYGGSFYTQITTSPNEKWVMAITKGSLDEGVDFDHEYVNFTGIANLAARCDDYGIHYASYIELSTTKSVYNNTISTANDITKYLHEEIDALKGTQNKISNSELSDSALVDAANTLITAYNNLEIKSFKNEQLETSSFALKTYENIEQFKDNVA